MALTTESFDVNLRLSGVPIDHIQTIMLSIWDHFKSKGNNVYSKNLMIKRFARAIALPDISSNDTFLSYLPLFHTFGRYFELMGSIFWGSTYTFAQSPSFNSLLKDFSIFKPSILLVYQKMGTTL